MRLEAPSGLRPTCLSLRLFMNNRLISSLALSYILASPFFSSLTPVASAETDGDILVSYGIGDFRDKKGRGPILSVSVSRPSKEGEHPKILADAAVNQPEMKPYPIRFEFYVNRNLVATQIRSPELPGPVGYEVLPNVATTPFNYAVVATMLTPNRSFSSAVYGAVFDQDLATKLTNCTLTLANPSVEGSGASQTYRANSISVTQQSNDSFSVSFTTSTLSDGTSASEVEASASLSLAAEKVTGSLLATRDSVKERFQISGTATLSDSNVDSFDAKTGDGATQLVCE
jgi:hypothetical protein